MKKVTLIIAMTIISLITNAQQNTVNVIASGDGKTKDESLNAALRHCIEETFGVFVSSNTTISNDSLIKDDIATIASGNIVSYKIITQNQIDGIFSTTVSAYVSPDNIVKIMKTKGYEFEVKGNVFAQNIMKEEFYKSQEPEVLYNFLQKWEKIKLIDFEIKIDEKPHLLKRVENKVLLGDININKELQKIKAPNFDIHISSDLDDQTYIESENMNSDLYSLECIFYPKLNSQFYKFEKELKSILEILNSNENENTHIFYEIQPGWDAPKTLDDNLFGSKINFRNLRSDSILHDILIILNCKSTCYNFKLKNIEKVKGCIYVTNSQYKSVDYFNYNDINDGKNHFSFKYTFEQLGMKFRYNTKYNYYWNPIPYYYFHDGEQWIKAITKAPSEIYVIMTLEQMAKLDKIEFKED